MFSLAMSFSSTTFRYAGLDNFTVLVRGTEKKGNENEIVTKSRYSFCF